VIGFQRKRHGQPLAMPDFAIAFISRIRSISERRTYQFDFGIAWFTRILRITLGLNSGFAIPQYNGYIASQNNNWQHQQVLIVLFLVTEDHVSMGANASQMFESYGELRANFAIELMNASQSHCRRPLCSVDFIEML
jgi:histidine ammonia-lyase